MARNEPLKLEDRALRRPDVSLIWVPANAFANVLPAFDACHNLLKCSPNLSSNVASVLVNLRGARPVYSISKLF